MSFVTCCECDKRCETPGACIRFHSTNEGTEAALSRTEWEFWNKFDLFFIIYFTRIHSKSSKIVRICNQKNRLPTTCTIYKIHSGIVAFARVGQRNVLHEGQRVKCATCRTNNWIERKMCTLCVTAYWQRQRSRFHARRVKVCGERRREKVLKPHLPLCYTMLF